MIIIADIAGYVNPMKAAEVVKLKKRKNFLRRKNVNSSINNIVPQLQRREHNRYSSM